MLLENLRFYSEETDGNEGFAEKLSKLGQVYVNDAFGAAHRKHSSTSVITKFFNNKKYLGLLLHKEIIAIERVLMTGKKPVIAVLGGAKVSSKITIINNFLEKLTTNYLGGGMAYTKVLNRSFSCSTRRYKSSRRQGYNQQQPF